MLNYNNCIQINWFLCSCIKSLNVLFFFLCYFDFISGPFDFTCDTEMVKLSDILETVSFVSRYLILSLLLASFSSVFHPLQPPKIINNTKCLEILTWKIKALLWGSRTGARTTTRHGIFPDKRHKLDHNHKRITLRLLQWEEMLFILIELSQRGCVCDPTELNGEKELQFFGLDFLCYKFPSHLENDRADNTHPYIHTQIHTHRYSYVIQGF